MWFENVYGDFHCPSLLFALLLDKSAAQFKLENFPSQNICTTHHYSITLTWQENLLLLDSSPWRTYFYWISMQKKQKKKESEDTLQKVKFKPTIVGHKSKSCQALKFVPRLLNIITIFLSLLNWAGNLLIYNILYSYRKV